MRLQIKSCPLEWCGKHLFPIYIYQRLPILLLSGQFIASYHLVYVIFCLIVTLVIAKYYRFWQIKL